MIRYMKKELDLSDLTMVDVFLNAANFAQHAFFTLAPPAIFISKLVTKKYPFNLDQGAI